jgi:hypothetical protein
MSGITPVQGGPDRSTSVPVAKADNSGQAKDVTTAKTEDAATATLAAQAKKVKLAAQTKKKKLAAEAAKAAKAAEAKALAKEHGTTPAAAPRTIDVRA